MAKAQRKPSPKPRNRKGLLPGEYRKRSTVFVERLRGTDEMDRFGDADLLTTDAYIVQTRRIDQDWTYLYEYNGQVVRIPAKVVDCFIRQRDAIIKEQRSDRAKDRKPRFVNELEDIDMSGI